MSGPRGGAAGSSEITSFSGFGSHKLPQAENQIASRNPRLRHLAARIHELGERPLYELFLELEHGADLHNTLELYAAASPARRVHSGARRRPVRQTPRRRNRSVRPMTARALVNGVIFKAPVEKTSKAGNALRHRRLSAMARVTHAHGGKPSFSATIAMAEVLRLGDGDPLAVAGEFDCQPYKTDAGEDRLSWSIMVDAVLSARAKPKKAKPSRGQSPALRHQTLGRRAWRWHSLLTFAPLRAHWVEKSSVGKSSRLVPAIAQGIAACPSPFRRLRLRDSSLSAMRATTSRNVETTSKRASGLIEGSKRTGPRHRPGGRRSRRAMMTATRAPSCSRSRSRSSCVPSLGRPAEYSPSRRAQDRHQRN